MLTPHRKGDKMNNFKLFKNGREASVPENKVSEFKLAGWSEEHKKPKKAK